MFFEHLLEGSTCFSLIIAYCKFYNSCVRLASYSIKRAVQASLSSFAFVLHLRLSAGHLSLSFLSPLCPPYSRPFLSPPFPAPSAPSFHSTISSLSLLPLHSVSCCSGFCRLHAALPHCICAMSRKQQASPRES